MPGRSFVGASQYRYGFNGKENDPEVKGNGNSIDFGARMYDSRLGRFMSRDPYESSFSYQTSYCFAGNSPMWSIDEDGGFQIRLKDKLKYRGLNSMLKTLSNLANSQGALTNPFISQFILQTGIAARYPNPDDQLDLVRQIFSYGSGPLITIQKNLASGGEEYVDGTTSILLDKQFVKDFENWSKRVMHNKIRNYGRPDLESSKGKWANKLDMFVNI